MNTMELVANAQPETPFDGWFRTGKATVAKNPFDVSARLAEEAAPSPYPAGATGSAETGHFEIQGFAQWRNVGTSGSLTTYNFGSTKLNDVGIGNLTPGPLFRFLWTPEKKILGATSKIWTDYGQIDRSRTRSITGTVAFPGTIYIINTTLNAALNTKQFEVGYAPRWGNDTFRIGPSITYERLDVTLTLTNLTPGAPPPIKRSLNVPNNVGLIGVDFDFTPNSKFDAYGRVGVIPCCGGGWHILESEFGAKFYFARHFGVLGGVRYSYMKRDFNVSGTQVGSATVGQYSGYLKFPGIGPFVGLSCIF